MKEFKYIFTILFLFSLSFIYVYSTSPAKPQHQTFQEHIDSREIEYYPNDYSDKDIDLKSSNLQKWLDSGSIGKFLNLHLTKSVHLRIPVNFIFVGFSGDGNRAFSLSEEHLSEWFTHIEHSLPNVIVPLGEDSITSDINETPQTHIEYSFDIQVSKVDSLVNTLIEDAIYWNIRNEDSEFYEENGTSSTIEKKERYYTNPYLISSMLSSLTDHLDLNNGYTIFILNPNNPLVNYNEKSKHNSIIDKIYNDDEEADKVDDEIHSDLLKKTPVYGYRAGLSNSELEKIYKNPKLAFNSDWNIDNDYQFISMFQLAKDHVEPGESVKQINENIKFKDLSRQSLEWAQQMSKDFIRYRNNTAYSQGPATDNCFYGSPDGVEDRWICAAPRLANHENKDLSAADYAQHLYNDGTWYEKFYVQTAYDYQITENCLVDSWISHKRFAFIDLTAGPLEWGPTIGGNGLKSNLTLPRVPSGTHEQRITTLKSSFENANEVLETLQSEHTLLQTVFENTCQDDDSPHRSKENCIFIKQSIDKVEGLIKDKQALVDIYKGVNNSPLESMDLLLGNLMESVEDLEMNNFKAHLGSVLSDSLRHLIAQPLPLFKIKFYDRVNFHIIFITDHTKYNPRHFTMFNYELFKHEVEKLKTPKQEFTFNIKMLSMAEDPSLSLAYHTSLKTILTPTITEDGTFETKLNYYIDSKEIKYQLTRLNPDNHEEDDIGGLVKSKHIPIFIFSLGSDYPVFIDKNKQAKALSNMVLAVQTNVIHNTTFSCNGKPTTLNLGNPMSAILSATALNLGGLVPNHYSYSEASMSATQQWQWSVGDSPNSNTFTFPFSYFSKFQLDAIHRNYIVSSLERSISLSNQASNILLNHKTNPSNYISLVKFSYNSITTEFNLIKEQWKIAADYLEKFEYATALSFALQAEKNSHLYLEYVKKLSEGIFISDCSYSKDSYSSRSIGIVIVCLCINVLILLSLALLNKKKSKLKIN